MKLIKKRILSKKSNQSKKRKRFVSKGGVRNTLTKDLERDIFLFDGDNRTRMLMVAQMKLDTMKKRDEAFPTLKYKYPALCLQMVRYRSSHIRYVPDEMKTQEMCTMVIDYTGDEFLEFIPETLIEVAFRTLPKTPELCMQMVLHKTSYIRFVPSSEQTQQMCDIVAESGQNELIKYVMNILIYLARNNFYKFNRLPNLYKTYELRERLLKTYREMTPLEIDLPPTTHSRGPGRFTYSTPDLTLPRWLIESEREKERVRYEEIQRRLDSRSGRIYPRAHRF